ncbi:trypsin-like cysteine/serine peptidase domain-containing protein [Cladorrhinum sp. PSN332]|nr:trypsin-like cysteine/serine peptidase domain-containing protein [Cladorrhinum sp. PSN332]
MLKFSWIWRGLAPLCCLKSGIPVENMEEVDEPDTEGLFRGNASSSAITNTVANRNTLFRYDLVIDEQHFQEGYLGSNDMQPVDPMDPDNLGCVFIEIMLEGRTEFQRAGSGFLVTDPDGNQFVVTAGHVVFTSLGLARSVKVTAAVGTGRAEVRYGIQANIQGNYYSTRAKINDLAMIKLNQPFGIAEPGHYLKTPVTGRQGIVAKISGFPGDTDYFKAGGQLHESTGLMRYFGVPGQRVFHDGHTEHGSSGGPIKDAKGVVKAVHTGYKWNDLGVNDETDWSKDGSSNLGIPIDREGNDFTAFFAAFQYPVANAVVNLTVEGVNIFGSQQVVRGGVAFSWEAMDD